MESIVIPFGHSGWERRTRLIEELLRSRPGPPYIYDDILILVPSSRMKRTYGKLFVDTIQRLYGVASLVQPQVQTLFQFFDRLSLFLTGSSTMDENSRLILLEGIIKQHLVAHRAVFGQSPDMLAPSLSPALAKMIEHLSEAGVTPAVLSAKTAEADFSDKTAVRLLTDVFASYERLLHDRGLADPAGMRARVTGQFDPNWLSPYTRIIIDGIHDAGGIETRMLGKITQRGNCTCLFDAPSLEVLKRAGEFHPLRITKDFISQIGVMPREDAATNADDLFVAQSLFSDRPFAETAEKASRLPSFNKVMQVLSAVTSREEVSLIAGEVKRSLKAGAIADSILVAFPSLDEYGPLVEEIFTDYGIPYNRALGRQLSTSPVTTAVISLLRACQEDFSGPSLLRIFSSPFLKFAGMPSVGSALDRLMRDRRITGGKHKVLSTLKYHAADERGTDILSEPLKDMFTALEPFSTRDAAPLSSWMARLLDLIAWSGLGERVSTIKGPLNINLQAYKKLNETLSSLMSAGRLFSEYRYTFGEWLFLLKKTFMQERFQVPPEDEGGVQVLGMGESVGHAWNEIYLGGLVDGKFPQRLPQNIFLPEQTLETMGVRTLERARLNAAYHFYRLILSAPKITLTYPENEGDKPVVPSPFLEELTPLKKAGLINRGIEKTAGIQFSLNIKDSNSIPELGKAISLSGSITGLEEVIQTDIDGMSGIRSALEYKPTEPTPAVIPHTKREFGVTELDDYISCPYDYYIKHVLRIQPLEEVTEDISPLARGSKVHAILRDFYRSWEQPVTRENRDEARARLRQLAEREFGREADTFRNRREKELFLTVMTDRFLDAEEEFWKQGMRPAYLEQKIEFFKLPLPDGSEVEIHAKIDRIDVDESGNFVIVDYKTGDYPKPKMNIEQDIFQLPVYAVMAQQTLNVGVRHALPLRKPIGLAYYDLKGKSGAGARDVVLFNKEARNDHPAAKPKASPKSAEEFKMILKQSMDKARKAVEGILTGDFSARPQDENKCRYCPNEMMCEKRNDA